MTATDFEEYRPELLAYCYRMLGSLHDAEDVLQETLLRAWRGFDRFDGRSSVRRWLYAIATRACLTAAGQRARRALPSALHDGEGDPAWVEPLPESVVSSRTGIRLAFVAALQHLPARQRAALILCDVLEFPAAEAAGLLGVTTAGVTSALQRARDRLRRLDLDEQELSEPAGFDALLERYADAFQRADVTALVGVLRDDVTLEMPPLPEWYAGRPAVLAFLGERVLTRPGHLRMAATRANGQPAVTAHVGDDLHALHVLSIRGGRISRIVAFLRD